MELLVLLSLVLVATGIYFFFKRKPEETLEVTIPVESSNLAFTVIKVDEPAMPVANSSPEADNSVVEISVKAEPPVKRLRKTAKRTPTPKKTVVQIEGTASVRPKVIKSETTAPKVVK
jgi:hypothetical protein